MTDENARKAVKSFEDLEVFRRAYRLALELHEASLRFPKHEQIELAQQLRKASKSVCANIAEGFAKQRLSPAEFRRFLSISIGSADEMRVWSRFAFDLGYVDEATWRRWRDGYEEVARMLQGLRRSWADQNRSF
jgi:four helix bundle protein